MFLLGTTPGYQKVFHEVMFPHHPIITPSLTASFFPDPVTSQPTPPPDSLTITPGNGGYDVQLTTKPARKLTHSFHQRRITMRSGARLPRPHNEGQKAGGWGSFKMMASALHMPLHVGLSLVASFGMSRPC